ncbi:hypothetical protein DPMN_154443 [Dreissena polymorpha]|uniref:Uncharacterized protein n=1 Tax=Dreissena polymorpha TaxID=45954 RepID=A0A9D4FL42_DREPO|nr:hypothetical protein DPMN_154443 [Dreissena polymorpha]
MAPNVIKPRDDRSPLSTSLHQTITTAVQYILDFNTNGGFLTAEISRQLVVSAVVSAVVSDFVSVVVRSMLERVRDGAIAGLGSMLELLCDGAIAGIGSMLEQSCRRIPPGLYEDVRQHIKEMLDANVIRESDVVEEA